MARYWQRGIRWGIQMRMGTEMQKATGSDSPTMKVIARLTETRMVKRSLRVRLSRLATRWARRCSMD